MRVKFYWGQNEGYSLGDSILDSSEKLVQRDGGEGQYMCDFGEGGVLGTKHFFPPRFLLLTGSRCHREGF